MNALKLEIFNWISNRKGDGGLNDFYECSWLGSADLCATHCELKYLQNLVVTSFANIHLQLSISLWFFHIKLMTLEKRCLLMKRDDNKNENLQWCLIDTFWSKIIHTLHHLHMNVILSLKKINKHVWDFKASFYYLNKTHHVIGTLFVY